MKRVLLIIFSVLVCQLSWAEHITGGEMYYTYLGPGANAGEHRYKITLKLYRDCNSAGAALDDEAPIAIYDKLTFKQFSTILVPRRSAIEQLLLEDPGPC